MNSDKWINLFTRFWIGVLSGLLASYTHGLSRWMWILNVAIWWVSAVAYYFGERGRRIYVG